MGRFWFWGGRLCRAVHLSNFSVQKNFENSALRSSMLPEENMWTSGEFQQYLRNWGCGSVWRDSIYPGMKKAVIAALQCTQDIVEMRKVRTEAACFSYSPHYLTTGIWGWFFF